MYVCRDTYAYNVYTQREHSSFGNKCSGAYITHGHVLFNTLGRYFIADNSSQPSETCRSTPFTFLSRSQMHFIYRLISCSIAWARYIGCVRVHVHAYVYTKRKSEGNVPYDDTSLCASGDDRCLYLRTGPPWAAMILALERKTAKSNRLWYIDSTLHLARTFSRSWTHALLSFSWFLASFDLPLANQRAPSLPSQDRII